MLSFIDIIFYNSSCSPPQIQIIFGETWGGKIPWISDETKDGVDEGKCLLTVLDDITNLLYTMCSNTIRKFDISFSKENEKENGVGFDEGWSWLYTILLNCRLSGNLFWVLNWFEENYSCNIQIK